MVTTDLLAVVERGGVQFRGPVQAAIGPPDTEQPVRRVSVVEIPGRYGAGLVGVERARGNLGAMLGEHGADRLDPETGAVLIDVIEDQRSRRSSSAAAKNADAVFKVSFALRSSAFSRSSSLILTLISVGTPGRSPRSISSRLIHPRKVSGFTSTSSPISRHARERDSAGYLDGGHETARRPKCKRRQSLNIARMTREEVNDVTALANVPVEAYYDRLMTLSDDELRLRDEVLTWLPQTIIDCHVHCNLPSHVDEIPESIFYHMMSSLPYGSLQQSTAISDLLFPGRVVRKLVFAHAFFGINHRAVNDYLAAEAVDLGHRVALFGPADDESYVVEELQSGRWAALKMYYLAGPVKRSKILDVFSMRILSAAQESQTPIILHVPTPLTASIGEVEEISKILPDLPIVLAHCGVMHLPSDATATAIRRAADLKNVFMDTARVHSAEVLSVALGAFGPSRILFGSDEPLSLLRSVTYHNPDLGPRIVTDFPYHWTDMEEFKIYGNLATNAVNSIWEQLTSLRAAIVAVCSQPDEATEAVLHSNANALFGF